MRGPERIYGGSAQRLTVARAYGAIVVLHRRRRATYQVKLSKSSVARSMLAMEGWTE